MTIPGGTVHLWCDNLSFKSYPQQTDAELKEQAETTAHVCFELEEPGHSCLSRKWRWFSLSQNHRITE